MNTIDNIRNGLRKRKLSEVLKKLDFDGKIISSGKVESTPVADFMKKTPIKTLHNGLSSEYTQSKQKIASREQSR